MGRKEVLIIGDGASMRFWPMWPFYLYLNRSAGAKASSLQDSAGRLRLVTPSTPGFRPGMPIVEAVRRFCVAPDPIVYFLVRSTRPFYFREEFSAITENGGGESAVSKASEANSPPPPPAKQVR